MNLLHLLKSDLVVLCPVYSAGEKKTYNFNQNNFSKRLISKKSNVQVINIKNQKELKNYFKKNLLDDEMVICMGAGSISNWIREIGDEIKMNLISQIKEIKNKISGKILFNENLSKYSWFNLEVLQKLYLNLKI